MNATTPTPRFGPWICKQRPAGDWVIDRLDRERMVVQRFGTYPTESAARSIHHNLVKLGV
jgi:hypothetical protein